MLLSLLDISLPLRNPVLQFSLILFIVLFAPLLLNRLRIPSLISLIIAGAVVGPHGFNLMARDSSIILFGTVGLLYIMFMAGLEIDVADFKKNTRNSFLFGLYTFTIALVTGIGAGMLLLGLPLLSATLIGSIFASHTLLLYPVISKLGIARNRAVNIAVGGTIITDTLALLLLATVTGMSSGDLSSSFWIRLVLSVIAFALVVLLLFPVAARWFFKHFDDSVLQYLFVLALVFMAGFLAEAAGVEPIIGAFFAGLALNRLIPHTSPLMNRVRFVGNAIFIPFFLIGVGMLINIGAFFTDFQTIKVAVVIIAAAAGAKYLSAWITQRIFGFSTDQRNLVYGLIGAHAAVALATVLIGYRIVTGYTMEGEPIRLLDESVLNGTILFILVTCTIATIVGQKAAQNIALAEEEEETEEKEAIASGERILIPLNVAETVDELVNLSVTIKAEKSRNSIYALHVADNTTGSSSGDEGVEKGARKLLEKAELAASSTDNSVIPLLRYDSDVVNAIAGVVREQKITNIVLGLHRKTGLSDSFLGKAPEGLLARCNLTTFIYKPVQPLDTIKRMLLVIPERGEQEEGFPLWMEKVAGIVRNTGVKLIVYSSRQSRHAIHEVWGGVLPHIEYKTFRDWDDFLVLSREIKPNDCLIIAMSRRGHLSWHEKMAKMASYLDRYFLSNSFILVYPIQAPVEQAPVKEPPFRKGLVRLERFGRLLDGAFKRSRRRKGEGAAGPLQAEELPGEKGGEEKADAGK